MERKHQANKILVQHYLEDIFNRADASTGDSYFPNDGVVFNGRRLSAQQLVRWTHEMRKAFPDFRLTIEEQIAEGNKVVTHVTFHGTHHGQFEGILATGKQVRYSGIGIDHLENGRIVESWHIADLDRLRQQLGAG
jgi:steroid delta-isomerase-like uncharacterized protein